MTDGVIKPARQRHGRRAGADRPWSRRSRLVAGVRWTLAIAVFPVMWVAAATRRTRDGLLIWGSTPIITNRYWSDAMNRSGRPSITLMRGYYPSINSESDFDRYVDRGVPRWIRPAALRMEFASYLSELFVLRQATVMHMPFTGGPLGATPAWRWEARLLRRAGVKTVILGYGGDFYRYSRIMDASLRHGLLASYPASARREEEVNARVEYWVRHADVLINGFQIDGLGRWDALPFSAVALDTDLWEPRNIYSDADGISSTVRVMHAPNHRGFKGTEFVVDAIEQLNSRGLRVELELVEGVPNDALREIMRRSDILIDQLIVTGYGLNAIEGMASGLPVLANLENDDYTRLFRRYSYLEECPVVSTTPETVVDVLETLVLNPALREELGRGGRAYAEKYHGYAAAQYLFGNIYDWLGGANIDLLRLFHPLTSEYVQAHPRVQHPLRNSRLPSNTAELGDLT